MWYKKLLHSIRATYSLYTCIHIQNTPVYVVEPLLPEQKHLFPLTAPSNLRTLEHRSQVNQWQSEVELLPLLPGTLNLGYHRRLTRKLPALYSRLFISYWTNLSPVKAYSDIYELFRTGFQIFRASNISNFNNVN